MSAIAVLGVVVFAVMVVAMLSALLAKGHGLAFGPLWLMPFRLAHPDSPWARRFYGPEKRERSRRRYPAETRLAAERDREIRKEWEGEDIAGQDRITRRALRKAGRF